jgi:hypothetical protein
VKFLNAISRSPRKCGPQALEKGTGDIGDQRIGDPEDVSPIHFSFVKSELPIGGKDGGLVDQQVTCKRK